ncbi:MAG TPA: TetR family transcriptional regulator [Pseudonocardiaceae bacterium]|jgi:DNA-binding transcriptional regulator YbjK|nr:TetR family transcriptional regulator [Pseudonocardiaceae bacterium]
MDADETSDAPVRSAARSRRVDPDRRARIVDAALDVIAEVGVAGASHRKIAARADVPLGSMTYHFADMDEVLRVSFEKFADTIATRYENWFRNAATADEARDAVVGLIHADLLGSQRELVLTIELYTLAARKPEFRTLTSAWMARSRLALRRFFDESTTHMLDALIEGLFVHAALDTTAPDRDRTVEAVRRVTAG